MARGNRASSSRGRGQWAYVFNSATVRNPSATRANSRGSRGSGRSSQRSRTSRRGRGRGRGRVQRGNSRGRGVRTPSVIGRSLGNRIRKAAPMEPSGFVSGDLGNLSAGARHDVVAVYDVVVKGKKGVSEHKFRLQDAKHSGGPISWLENGTRKVDSSVSRGRVTAVTVKFDPGFFRNGIYGQVAVLTVQSTDSESKYDSLEEMLKAVGATRTWNWPGTKFETTIPMHKWHGTSTVVDEDDDVRWTVLVGLKIQKRDLAIEDQDEVLKISVHWLLDCPKPV